MFKLPSFLLKDKVRDKVQEKASFFGDASIAVAFVGAISILLLVAGYVIFRLSSDRVYREKWKDYNDCGWA